MSLPLEGVTVLDFTSFVAGPYCSMILGDMGADVIKVEAFPGGDTSRAFDPKINGESYCFSVINRNKRSLAIVKGTSCAYFVNCCFRCSSHASTSRGKNAQRRPNRTYGGPFFPSCLKVLNRIVIPCDSAKYSMTCSRVKYFSTMVVSPVRNTTIF